MFFKSIPTSQVTPSPNLRFAAATLEMYDRIQMSIQESYRTYLECIFLLDWQSIHRGSILSHLVKSLQGIMSTTSSATMARTRCVLSSVDESPDDIA